MPKIELKPLGEMDVQLSERRSWLKVHRVVIDVLSVKLTGDKINPELTRNDGADWLTDSDNFTLGALHIRLTLKTDVSALSMSNTAAK